MTLLYDDEGESTERAGLETHLRECRACATLLAGLGGTRAALGAWPAPSAPLGFARIHPAQPALWRRVVPWAGMSAAAMLTLAASAGLAGLDIRYDGHGVTLRTGWQSVPPVDPLSMAGAAPPATSPVSAPAPADPRTAWVARAAVGEPPWRADFDLLGAKLREEVAAQANASEARLTAALAAAAANVSRVSAPAAIDEDRLMRRIAQQIDQSEIRQQQNLALRVAELGREFQVRRQADFVQFEQGLARVEQQRRDLIRRVAVSQAAQP